MLLSLLSRFRVLWNLNKLSLRFFLYLTLFQTGFALNAQTWEERSILISTKQEVNDEFGRSVALSENYAAVGSSSDDENGAVYIFKRNADDTYSPEQQLRSSDPEYTFVGHSLAMTDSYVVVGDPSSGPQLSSGSVFIFEKDMNGTWNEVQRLTPSDPHGLDRFGTAVAISDNTIAVSSPGKSIEYQEGAVYIFERDPSGQWIEKQKMMSSDFQRDDHFGLSLIIQNDILMVGAPYEDENTQDIFGYGAVYFFEKEGSGMWTEKQKIVAPERVPNSYFGWSIDLSGNSIIIGASNENYSLGAIYFFERENGQWVFKTRFTSSTQERFGHDVAIDGNTAVVSLGEQSAKYTYSYVRSDNGTWTEANKIYGPPFTNFRAEKFGNAIDLQNNRVIIGAPNAYDATEPTYDFNTGEAYIYELTGVPLPFEKTTWIPDDLAKGSFPFLIDFDNDNDLDLFIAYSDDNVRESRILEFNNKQYQPISQRFPLLESNSAVKWHDVNGDGWLDFIIRYEFDYKPKTELYLNNRDKSFTATAISDKVLDNMWNGGFHFADYDNDTDLDLLVQLKVNPGDIEKVRILTNDGSFEFSDSGFTFEGVIRGDPWSDYNKDGFQDFAIIQKVTCDTHKLVLLKNMEGNSFEIVNTNLNTLNSDYINGSGDMVWADSNNDGYTDLIWSGTNGCSSGDGGSNIVINDGGIFRNTNGSFQTLLREVHLTVVDFNNDGVMDMMAYGDPDQFKNDTKFYLGTGEKFNKITLNEMPNAIQQGGTALGDIEADGDLDAVIAGEISIFQPRIFVYQNNASQGWTVRNLPPSIPAGLKATMNGSSVSISWNASTDDLTPTRALTYNIMLTRNDSIIVSPSSTPEGVRQIYQVGNVGFRLGYLLQNLKQGDYKVAVQAIDNGYAGSAFTTETAFSVTNTITAAELDLDSSIQLFPNPAHEQLVIVSENELLKGIGIYDILGHLIHEQTGINVQSTTVDLKQLERGIYFVKLKLNGQTAVKRIVKE